jgi:hypothetical protein
MQNEDFGTASVDKLIQHHKGVKQRMGTPL